MPIRATSLILEHALDGGYGVAAINIVNDLTMEAVLAAATEAQAPLIVQTSVKTVQSIGMRVLHAMFQEMARDVPVPVALHLDHCPDRALISACLAQGWQSVLFDGSRMSVADNRAACAEIVVEAHALGAAVEGEIEPIRGVEDGIGSPTSRARPRRWRSRSTSSASRASTASHRPSAMRTACIATHHSSTPSVSRPSWPRSGCPSRSTAAAA